jgi:nitroreductase
MPDGVFQAVRTLLSVREYQDREIPVDVLRRVIEAGRLTGSSMNGQPWHFVLVRDRETLRRLGELVRTGRYVTGAAAAIVVAAERGNPFAISDASRAIQSMMLIAWDDGVGSNWTGFGGLEEARRLVGLPDSHDVLAVLPLGYPARAIGKGRKNRKPLAQVASAERFGTPLE